MKELPGDVFVAGQITPRYAEALAEQGFQSIINNRPDFEGQGAPTADMIDIACKAFGLEFRYVPMGANLTPEILAKTEEAYANLPRPIFAYCARGLRSAALWGFAHAESMGVDPVMEAMIGAGFNLEMLRPQIEAHLERKRTEAVA